METKTRIKLTLSSGLLAAALILGAGGAEAQIQVKIGVLSDMSSLYADIGGPGSVVAAKLALEDFDPASKGMAVTILQADHQNKPDIGVGIVRQWFDVDHVDVIADVPTSSVALAVAQVVKEKNKVFLISGAASSDLTGKACTPNNVHWAYDTYSLAHGTGGALVKQGGKTWFFITADYAFGLALERDTSAVVEAAGGKVLGDAKHPLNNSDFSSFLLQAQASKAQVVGLANAGGDTINSIKQAAEFGIVKGGQRIAGLLVFITDVNSLGLETAQGLTITTGYYWDLNDKTRAFAKRFAAQMNGKMPTMVQAGVYSSLLHYLEAVKTVGSAADGAKVVEAMRQTSYDDPLFGKTTVRADGRAIHDMYLVEVKKPAESKGPWDYYNVLQVIPGEEAFRPLKDGACPLVKQ
jgi:branched-chain amino acid transport system substrate-binding protein